MPELQAPGKRFGQKRVRRPAPMLLRPERRYRVENAVERSSKRLNQCGVLIDKWETGLNLMKRAVIIAGLLICSLSDAYATTHYEMSYRDTSRPHGHKRSDAVYNSALDFCYSQTGLSRDDADTRAFKDCMKGRGFRWLATKEVQDAPGRKRDDSFIDPDTGMSCRNIGGASICDPPQGTVKYQNRHGLNCTRTGIVSICSNL
jgi:hypothetical protein